MALYHKYRPSTLSEVIGQEHITIPLARAIDSGKINHAYLFSGPRGCGKTSSARILARALNCEQGPISTPCGKCDSCIALAPGGSGNLDVVELDAASHGGVDDTRDLRDRAFYSPAQSRYRIFVIDEAHMVSTAGFNALLKIVEEPPDHVIFIFATTEPDKVITTIKSRTHHYPFRLLVPTALRSLLDRVLIGEGMRIEDEVYPLLLKAGGGSPRDTLSILDQLIAGCDDNKVYYDQAARLLGITDASLLDITVEALAESNATQLFSTVEQALNTGHDPRRFAADLLTKIRDLLLIRTIPDAPERGIVDVPPYYAEILREQSHLFTVEQLTYYASTLHDGLHQLRGATSPRLLLEIVIARIFLSTTDAEKLESRLAAIEQTLHISQSIPYSVEYQKSPISSASEPKKHDQVQETISVSPQESVTPVDNITLKYTRKSQKDGAISTTVQPPITQSSQETTLEVASTTTPKISAVSTKISLEVEATSVPDVILTPKITGESAIVPMVVELSDSILDPAVQDIDEQPAPTSCALPTLAELRKNWPNVRKHVHNLDKVIEVMLSHASVYNLEGETVIVHHDSAPLVERLSSERGRKVLLRALELEFGPGLGICIKHYADTTPITEEISTTYENKNNWEKDRLKSTAPSSVSSVALDHDTHIPPKSEDIKSTDLSTPIAQSVPESYHEDEFPQEYLQEKVAEELLTKYLGVRKIHEEK